MKRKLTGIAQDKMRENWLAPQGSARERQIIESLLRYEELTVQQKDMLLKYRKTRDRRDMRYDGFWDTAKKLKMGHNFDLAMSRHDKLKGNTWFVAYCIANSVANTRKEIGEMLGISVEGVRYYRQKISDIISKEYGERKGMADDALITTWFLGL